MNSDDDAHDHIHTLEFLSTIASTSKSYDKIESWRVSAKP